MSSKEHSANMWSSDEFWASPYNFDATITNRPDLPSNIIIHDTTLRDGEQTPGVVFTPDEKVTIAKLLDEIGVDRIEAGMPSVSMDNKEAIQAIIDLGLKAEIYCSCPAGKKESDIDLVASWGVDGILTSVPTGIPRLKYQYPDLTEDRVIEMAIRSVSRVKNKGIKATFVCMEVSRSERGFLIRLLEAVAKQAFPDAVAIYDTAGCFLPKAAANMVRLVKEVTGLPVEVHFHNCLGLALANTLEALEAGAETAHVTVNGLGEHGGNVSIDELTVILHYLYGIDTRINCRRLTELSKVVARLSNVYLNANKPVIGDGIYCREVGPGTSLIKQAPLAIYAIAPEAVGQTVKAVLGKMSGLESIETKITELGIDEPLDREQKKVLLGMIKSRALEKKSIVDDAEFRVMVGNIVGRNKNDR